MEIPLDSLVKYAFLDPASGKQSIKRTRARSAIVVIGVDPWMRVFVLHTWADRASTMTIVEQVFKANEIWKPKLFGCEANAQQSLFAGAIRDQAMHRHIRLPLTPVNQPTKIDKDFRIRSVLQPVLAEGRLFMHPSQHELRVELQSFPMAPTKDLVDALASAISLAPTRPNRRLRDQEVEELAAYLRAIGAPPHVIEARVREAQGAAA